MAITYIEKDGGRLAVEVDGEGPLIVCSPALGDTRDSYGPLAEQLVAAGYRVARFDLRGHGDSTTTFRRYGDEPTAEDFISVVNELGGGPAVLAGSSLSAGASYIAAAQHPDKVAGLVLLAPFLRNPPGSKLLVKVFHFSLWRPWGPFIWRFYAATLWPGLGERAKERATSSTNLLKRPGHWSAFHATVVGANHDAAVGPLLGRTQAPALIIIGDSDPDWSDPLAEARWVASNFKDAQTITVPGAGHAPMFEKPDVVAPGVLRFLEKIKFNKGGNTAADGAGAGPSSRP